MPLAQPLHLRPTSAAELQNFRGSALLSVSTSSCPKTQARKSRPYFHFHH